MLRGAFRTKEGKIIAIILGVIVIIMCIFILTNSGDKQFVEQAVMAENYLKAGNYEQAIMAYDKALSMKNSDQQLLSIGLSEAYIGINDYDKALEVLRSYYQKTSGVNIKEKIEEVISEKTDYEYLQSISRADVYFSNKEYDKAISEYEKAKLIKSKEVTSYKKIAEAYIEKGEYNLAREEVLEGQALTQSEELVQTLATVDSYLVKVQYDGLVTQASEYIYQENYEDGITKYQEAIIMLPQEEMAYRGLAETYITLKRYSEAVLILQNAIMIKSNNVLEDLLEEAAALKAAEDQRNNILLELYSALEDRDIDKVTTVMELSFFKEDIAGSTPIYHGINEGDIKKDFGMIVYDREKVYCGEIENGIKKGRGIYFVRLENKNGSGYYYYEGEWDNDIPNGVGKTEEMNVLINDGKEEYESKTVTKGFFYNAVENDTMNKYFYENNEETGRVLYIAQDGVPLPSNQKDPFIPSTETDGYAIGELYLGDVATGKYYFVKPQTVWGVKPFMKSK